MEDGSVRDKLFLDDVASLLEQKFFSPDKPASLAATERDCLMGTVVSYAMEFCFCEKLHLASVSEPYLKWSTCRQALQEFLNRMFSGEVVTIAEALEAAVADVLPVKQEAESAHAAVSTGD